MIYEVQLLIETTPTVQSYFTTPMSKYYEIYPHIAVVQPKQLLSNM